MQYCIQFTIFLGRGYSDDFHSAFPLLHNSGNQGGDSATCKYVYSNYKFWKWGNNYGMGSETHWTTVKWT